jgi:hypothetical protein
MVNGVNPFVSVYAGGGVLCVSECVYYGMV